MVELHVQNIPDSLYRRVQQIAQQNGQSINEHILMLLRQSSEAEQRRQAHRQEIEKLRMRYQHITKSAPSADASVLIGEIRAEIDARWEQ